MKTIVLISCTKDKLDGIQPAELLYQKSDLFKKSLRYAKEIVQPDQIFILSALHGLIELTEKIEPYNVTLKTMPVAKRREWAERVLESLKGKTNIENDRFVILAGERYREFLLPHLKNYEIPMKGMKQGPQRAWLKKQLEERDRK